MGGRAKVPMAALRTICGNLGWEEVRTYIQSGNVVFLAGGKPSALERELEAGLASQLGVTTSVMVRTAKAWKGYIAKNPFPEEARNETSRVLLYVPKSPPLEGAAEAIQSRAKNRERVARVEDALCIYYPVGAGQSKLTPTLIDRSIGSPATGRNWRTVLELDSLASAINGK